MAFKTFQIWLKIDFKTFEKGLKKIFKFLRVLLSSMIPRKKNDHKVFNLVNLKIQGQNFQVQHCIRPKNSRLTFSTLHV